MQSLEEEYCESFKNTNAEVLLSFLFFGTNFCVGVKSTYNISFIDIFSVRIMIIRRV